MSKFNIKDDNQVIITTVGAMIAAGFELQLSAQEVGDLIWKLAKENDRLVKLNKELSNG